MSACLIEDFVRVLRGSRLARKNTNFGKTLIPGDKTDHVDSERLPLSSLFTITQMHHLTSVAPA
eukprot:scaffold236943_cov27-Attheya_sp.AAC.1